jgi:hypothetical protein
MAATSKVEPTPWKNDRRGGGRGHNRVKGETSIKEIIHTQLKDTTYLRHRYWEQLKRKDP